MNKVTFLVLLISNFLFSQNVVLDPSFGVGGKIVHPSMSSITSIIQLSEGKTIGFYVSDYTTFGNQHLVRFNVDGSIDNSFGVNGIVDSILYREGGIADAIKLQADGKILMVGRIGTGNSGNFGVVRYNIDGSLDINFGNNGYANIDISNSSDWPYTLCIQSDNKILVGGYSSIPYSSQGYTSSDLSVIRLTSTGILDTSFATNGKYILNVGTTNNIPFTSGVSADFVEQITTDQLGNIYLGASTNANESIDNAANFLIVALNTDGIIKTSFGSNGKVMVDFGDRDYLYSIKTTSDNKIIACGQYSYLSGTLRYSKIAMLKLLSDGNHDTTFGTDGRVVINKNSSTLNDIILDFEIQNDGKLLCTGTTSNDTASNADFLIIRFNEDGTIDTTFNSLGYATLDFNNSFDFSSSLFLNDDGKILLAGGTQTANNNYNGALARFTLDNLSTSQFSKSNFSVAPNPFSNNINLSFTCNENQVLDIDLYGTNGRKIQNLVSQKQFYSGDSQLKLDLPETLSKGIYFLKINDEKQTKSIKIVK